MSRIELSPELLEVDSFDPADFCRELERGKILYFPDSPSLLEEEEVSFLLEQRQSDSRYRKNIAYRPLEDRVTGVAGTGEDAARLQAILRGYSRRATRVLERLLTPYAEAWKLDYASFRPIQEQGREVKQKRRNDLLHVDAFPTRPTQGDRILRFFTNINPDEPRHWIVGRPFEESIENWVEAGFPVPGPREPLSRAVARRAKLWMKAVGVPVAVHSRYDYSMLELHDFLKADTRYQETSEKEHLDFAPGSSWIVFTDLVPHAALSGRFALEQTFIVDRSSLLLPEKAPLRILERLAGSPLTT